MTFISDLLNRFGYIVLYILLTLELMALPFPGEILMTYCGFLVFKGNLNYIVSIIFSTAGIITGVTISYFIGKKLGKQTFDKYSNRFHLGADKLEKVSKWFDKYEYGFLIIVCFLQTSCESRSNGTVNKNFIPEKFFGSFFQKGTNRSPVLQLPRSLFQSSESEGVEDDGY